MALLGLLGLRKILIHILDVDERPSEVVADADAVEPGSFGGKTGCAVKVAYCCLILGSSYTLLMVSFGLGRLKSSMCSSIAAEEGTEFSDYIPVGPSRMSV